MTAFLTLREASQRLNVSLPTVLRWVKDGKLSPGPALGRRAKTVTIESCEKLAADEIFQATLSLAKRNQYSTRHHLLLLEEKLGGLEAMVTKVLAIITQGKDTKPSATLSNPAPCGEKSKAMLNRQKSAEQTSAKSGSKRKGEKGKRPQKNKGSGL
jgi:excisionase family DNA binding protein